MNMSDYIDKILELLHDKMTYEKVHPGFAQQKASEFKKKAREILTKSKRGKCLLEGNFCNTHDERTPQGAQTRHSRVTYHVRDR